MSVYKAINEVQKALSLTGIAKDKVNTQGASYKFRGIDDIYNALAPLLATHGLCIIPRMLTRICDERLSQKGNALFYVTVHAEFDFVSSLDGSKHTASTFGEAMDSGDKATNKAMSAAYKYAAFQTFCIPTEGDNDADASTHIVKPKSSIIPASPKTETLGLSDSELSHITDMAQALKELVLGDMEKEALDMVVRAALEEPQRIALNNMLDSKTRAALKAENQKRKEK